MCTSMYSDCDSGFAGTQRTSESDTDSSQTDLELPSVKTSSPSPRTRHYRRDFTSNNALILLEECEFPINLKGDKLARNMGISFNERHRLRVAISQGLNSETALEEAIHMFQSANTRPVTWNMFISRVKSVDRFTATKMRRKLGITATPNMPITSESDTDSSKTDMEYLELPVKTPSASPSPSTGTRHYKREKLQKICDNRILSRISGRMDPLIYVSHFALESDCDEILHCCADKDTSALSINLDMLFKWKKRKDSEATYQALLEIFQQANDAKMINLVLKYAANSHSTQTLKPEELKFPRVNNRDDIAELEKKYTEITEKFAFISEQIIQSLKKTKQLEDLKYYLSNAYRFQFESTDNITSMIDKTSSWFNIKVLKSLVNRYGTDKDKDALLDYEGDLLTYLQQSLFNIPAESFQSSNDTTDIMMCYLKIPDEDVEMLDLSGEDVLQIERNLADYLGIPREAFNLCQYRLGCIELVFSIPTTLYESNCTLEKNVVLDRFKNEFRLNVDLEDILPSHLTKLYLPKLKPSLPTEEPLMGYFESEETIEDTNDLVMKDEGQQKKPSSWSITLTGKTGVGKSSLINSFLPERVRNDDEFEDTDSYFGSESDIQTDSDDDETYISPKVKTTSTSPEVSDKEIVDIHEGPMTHFDIVFEAMQRTSESDTDCSQTEPHDEIEVIKMSPNSSNVLDFIKCHSARWFEIAIELKVPYDTLESLRHDVTLADRGRLDRVLMKWIQSQCSPVIIHTLVSMDLKATAGEVQDYLKHQQLINKFRMVMKDEGQQKKPSSYSITLIGITGVGKSSLAAALLHKLVRNEDEFENTNSYFRTKRVETTNNSLSSGLMECKQPISHIHQLLHSLYGGKFVPGFSVSQQLTSEFGDNSLCIDGEGNVWMADNSIDFTTNDALNLLEECEFPINSKWEKLARNMGISLDERHLLRVAISQGLNSKTALVEAIDMFQRNNTRPVTWNMFLSRVENVDWLTATKMRRKLQITATGLLSNIQKLQKRCDDSILLRISGRMDPLCYVSHFALESEWDEIRLCCADNDTSALSINLDMLLKWKRRKGPNATYQALLEIFEKANDEKMIILILKYAETSHTTHAVQSMNLMFPRVSSKDDILELKEKHSNITEKFAYLSAQIIKSLEKTQRPRHLACYLSKALHFQFESTDDITDIIAKTSSWFNIKVMKNVVNRFGSKEDKDALLDYEGDLHTYLQQSLINIPAESFQSSNDTIDTIVCYLKIADENVNILDLSGEDVLQIERNLADYFGIPREAFNLCQYRLGCIELVFSIPTTLYRSNCTLKRNVVLDRFKNEFRLTVDLEDILPSHLTKLYLPKLKPSLPTEESDMKNTTQCFRRYLTRRVLKLRTYKKHVRNEDVISYLTKTVKTANTEPSFTVVTDFLHFGMVVPRSNVSQQLTSSQCIEGVYNTQQLTSYPRIEGVYNTQQLASYPCIEGVYNTQQLTSCIKEEGNVWMADNSIALPLKNTGFSTKSPVTYGITHGEGSGCPNVGTREDVPIGEKEIVIMGMRRVVPEDITGSVPMGTRGAIVWITGDVPMNTTEFLT